MLTAECAAISFWLSNMSPHDAAMAKKGMYPKKSMLPDGGEIIMMPIADAPLS